MNSPQEVEGSGCLGGSYADDCHRMGSVGEQSRDGGAEAGVGMESGGRRDTRRLRVACSALKEKAGCGAGREEADGGADAMHGASRAPFLLFHAESVGFVSVKHQT